MPQIILTDSTDPHVNLAYEEHLLHTAQPDTCILYLWTNASTVVIGRNQNPWRECRVEQLEQSGGVLSRRTTGGGAVYHDIGNLNFSFVMGKNLYSIERQARTIVAALASLGIQAEVSGRNDMTVNGLKFSGNAFAHRSNASLHHGTLLVNADMDMLGKFLTASKNKLQAKGVSSVRARVTNLSALAPMDKPQLIDALITAFQAEYGSAEQLTACYDHPEIARLIAKHRSWEWRFGQTPQFDFEADTRFDWGEVVLCIEAKNGLIRQAKLYSDAMDEEYIASLDGIFNGLPFNHGSLVSALSRVPVREENLPHHQQIMNWMEHLEL